MVNDHWTENSRPIHIAITHVAFHIHLPHLPSSENRDTYRGERREKIPNSKHRIPNNRQYPRIQYPRPKNSEIGIWKLFGIWHFGFGTSKCPSLSAFSACSAVNNNKKSPLLVNKKGLGFSKSYLIFQGISTLLELAPASRSERDRLLWHLRASPSATLDKILKSRLPEHDNLCQEKNRSPLIFYIFR
jgi:hypothetical protein